MKEKEKERIQSLIEAFKKRNGEDVTVTIRYWTGAGYTSSHWWGMTEKLTVGPCDSVEEAMECLEKEGK